MTERTIILCRHGETDANANGEFLSYRDPSLSAAGRASCERLRASFEGLHVDRVFCSPARRCRETAELALPQVRYEICNELREVHFGEWEGHTIAQLTQLYPQQVEQRRHDPAHFRPPGGESFADVRVRLLPFVARMQELEGLTLLIGHRGTLSVLERMLLGLPVDNQSVAPIEPGAYRVLSGARLVPFQSDPSAS